MRTLYKTSRIKNCYGRFYPFEDQSKDALNIIGNDEQEHIILLTVKDWWISDPVKFLFKKLATLFFEAIGDRPLVQCSYQSEQLLLEKLPQFRWS